jgi:hypothetical protein
LNILYALECMLGWFWLHDIDEEISDEENWVWEVFYIENFENFGLTNVHEYLQKKKNT